MLVDDAVLKALTLEQIPTAIKADKTLLQVIASTISSNWIKKPATKPQFHMRNDLSVANGILLFDNRIVIPASLREKVLQLAHESHQGVVKIEALLRDKVWSPGINAEIEELIKHCHTCEVTTASKSKAQPLAPRLTPEQTWDTLAIDLQGPFPSGDNLLVMIDYRSRYSVVYLIRNTSAGKILKCMNSTFSLFGYPKAPLSDNGPQFKSVEFRNYCEQHGIKQQLISPYYPAANAEVENINRTLKKAIQRAHIKGKDWKKEIEKFLLAYRSTPHSMHKVKNLCYD